MTCPFMSEFLIASFGSDSKLSLCSAALAMCSSTTLLMPRYCGLLGPNVASALRIEDWSCGMSYELSLRFAKWIVECVRYGRGLTIAVAGPRYLLKQGDRLPVMA